jgi:hypothetical protein
MLLVAYQGEASMAERLDPAITTWRKLIRSLAERHHDGHYYPMAARVRVSAGLVHQWKKGIVKAPTLDSIVRVCAAYDLELMDVIRFGAPRQRPARPIGGGSSHDGTPLVSLAETMSRLSDAVARWLHVLWCPPLPLPTTV